MIEKLELIKAFNCSDTPQAKMQHHSYHNDCIKKINELVDAVNELTSCVGQLGVEFTDTTPAEKAQDKFAEQRNWVGCLCELWSGNSKNHRYGILKGIAKNTYKGYKTIHKYQALSMSFEHCEPVKPDDDIIYKGGDNE